MTLWVKICGLTTPEAVAAAVSARADAIGFVFAPSKRRVTAAQAKQLAGAAPSHIQRVAVMLHPDQQCMDEICALFKPDVVQTDADDLRSLRIPAYMQMLPVFRNGIAGGSVLPPRVLFEGARSGTGERADWSQAAALARRTQLILAGGLNARNVGSAIAAVAPFGVDVSTGVEREPGIKDSRLIHEFVRAARAAVREVGESNAG